VHNNPRTTRNVVPFTLQRRTKVEHPDVLGARYIMMSGFPYMVFYTVRDRAAVVVAVEYATRDYVDRIAKRTEGAK
jgi:hypothetical protein